MKITKSMMSAIATVASGGALGTAAVGALALGIFASKRQKPAKPKSPPKPLPHPPEQQQQRKEPVESKSPPKPLPPPPRQQQQQWSEAY